MPILTVHLSCDTYAGEQLERLLVSASEIYARVLDSPLERVRVFLNLIERDAMAVGGEVVATSDRHAPFFEAIVLEGRPAQQKQLLMEAITDLLEDVLQVDRAGIRGVCWSVPPEDWCIAGTPASTKRAREIRARENAD